MKDVPERRDAAVVKIRRTRPNPIQWRCDIAIRIGHRGLLIRFARMSEPASSVLLAAFGRQARSIEPDRFRSLRWEPAGSDSRRRYRFRRHRFPWHRAQWSLKTALPCSAKSSCRRYAVIFGRSQRRQIGVHIAKVRLPALETLPDRSQEST